MNNVRSRKITGSSAAGVAWQHSLRRQTLWAALSLALSMPMAQAQTVPDGHTHTGVIAAPNDVPVVNIAAPNGAGVSDNTYDQFNVASNGLIFNNSGKVSNTQLAGYIGGNPNLGANQVASLIINEVTSTAPSQLNGAMEVAGHAAQVVVANPNGISCNGCGFINAPRGTLTTGKPLFASDGSLSGFAVTQGTIAVNGSGLPAGSTDQVDLLARAVAINAGVWARQLNVVTGANRISFQTLAAQPMSATGATPSVALDVSALGGMYANAIFLVGTEAGLGVNNQGRIIAQNGDLTITSTGEVELAGKTTATGNVAITTAQSLVNQGTLAAGGDVSLATGNFTNDGVLYGNGAITLSANGAISNSGQIEAQSGALAVQAQGAIIQSSGGSLLYAGGPTSMSGASFNNAGKLESAQGLTLQVSGDMANSGRLSVDTGNFNLSAATIENTGSLLVGGDAALNAGTSLASSGTLIADGAVTLVAPNLMTAGAVQAGTTLGINGGALDNNGKLHALGGNWTATLSGAFTNQGNGDIYSIRGLSFDAAALNNAGGIEARQAVGISTGGVLVNSGTLQSDQSGISLNASSLTNTGTLSANQNLRWQVVRAAQNAGVLVSGQAMSLSSGRFDNQAGGQIQSGTDLALSAATLNNEGLVNAKGNAVLDGTALSNADTGQMLAAGTLTLDETGDISNAGVLQADSDITLARATSLTNAAGGTLYAGQDFNLALSQVLSNAGMLYAARTSTLSAGSIANMGTLRSSGTLSLTSAGNVVSSGAIEAQSVSLLGGADVTNGGKLYAIDGGLTVQAAGAFSSLSSGDIYSGQSIGMQTGSFANAGTFEAAQSVDLVAQGSADNSGDLQADQGNLAIAGGSLSNQGTLSAAGATQLTSADSLGNSGKLVTGQTLAVTAANFSNGGQIQSGGNATLRSAGIVNSGLLQAGGSLHINHNANLTNHSGGSVLAAGNVSADTSSLLINEGVMQAGGILQIDGTGTVNNSAGATLYGTQLTTLQLGGGLSNAGTVFGAQGVNLITASLGNSGTLRSGAALDVATQGDADNSGTAYALGLANWNMGGALANAGVLAADGDVTVLAASLAGNGTLAAGLQSDGSLGTAGNLSVTTSGNLAAGGRSLAAGNLEFAGSAIDLSGSQMRASNITLAASQGNVTNAGGDLAANGTVAITTQASLVNGGSTAAQGGKISAGTLTLQAAALDNRNGLLVQTGTSDLNLELAGNFANANGTLATNAHDLTISAAAIDNTAGTIQDAGDGTLGVSTSGDLTNINGKIAGNGALALQASGILSNDGGLLSVAGNVTATAASFDNVGGTLIGQNVDLTVAQVLTNTGSGTIQAGGALQLDAGSLDNTAGYIKVTSTQSLNLATSGALTNGIGGFIGGNGAAAVRAGSLVNAGQVYAGGTLNVSSQGQFTNDGGAAQAQGTATIASSALSNRRGRIEAGSGDSTASLNLTAASLDNTGGRIANAGMGASTFTVMQGATNTGGTLGGQGAVTLSAASLDNSQSGKLVAGESLTLGLGSLNNVAGDVYAAGDLDWNNATASFTNTQGSLQTGGNLSLGLASLNNTGGTIASNQSGTLSLSSYTDLGKVAAGEDLSLTLGGNYTNVAGSQLSANRNLTLNVAGNFENATGATLQAVNQLAVNAANIDNAAGATLNSAATVLTANGALTNEGSIEGNAITLTAGSLTNTANIIGGSLTLTAGSLTNGADLGLATDNNPYQSALIAGADDINLYISGTLLNRDATIFSLGTLTIGADASGDQSQAVTNISGDIEADGRFTLNAHQFTNKRRIVNTATHVLTSAEQAANTSTTTSTFDWTTDPKAVAWCAQYATTIGANGHAVRCGPMGYYGDSGHETLTEQVRSVNRLVSASAQSKLLGGGDITLNGSVMNNASVIAAGNNLIINGQNGGNGGGNTAGATVKNVAWVPTAVVQTTDQRAVDGDYLGSRWYSNRENGGAPLVYWTGTSNSTVALDSSGSNGWITIAPGAGLAATMSAGNTVSITAHTIDNATVGANGQPVQHAIGLGDNNVGQSVGGGSAGTVGQASGNAGSIAGIALGSAPNKTDGGTLSLATAGKPAISSPASVAPGSTASSAAPQMVSTLVGPNASAHLPQTGLYTVNVQPDSQFLFETNPQFTQYNNFISSNYLLQQLGLNPQQTEQRLGDGFYEQQLVLDQITDLTGRRYLADDTDALDQYRDLMSNAVNVARQFDLSVGVALTPEQMADLTQDIVWLVSVNVDGHQVLEPILYLSAADAKNLAASGATIAGKNVILTASGDLTNNGTISASNDAQLTASNLLNSGTISAGNDLSLTAAQNILNGGTLQAGGNVSLMAGNDVLSGVNVAQSLGTVNLSGLNTAFSPVALSNLSLPGAISAGGNLAISAGRDLSLDEAPVSAGANLSLAAGRDLTATASAIGSGQNVQLLAGRDLDLNAIAQMGGVDDASQSIVNTIHTVTGITAGDSLLLAAGHDLTSQGAQLNAGNQLALSAGHDVTLNAVTDNTFTGSGQESGQTFVTQTQSDDLARGTTLIGAQGVTVAAGHDLTTEGATLESDNGAVNLAAGGNMNLNAANETHASQYLSINESGGLLSSKTTTVADDVTATHAVGTVVSGNTVNLQSGRDMTLQGATVVGSNGVTLDSGGAINVEAATDTVHEDYQKTVKTSGFLSGGGIGVTVGERTQQVTTGTDTTALNGSLIGTINGNVNINAATNYTQVASSLLSQHGDVNVLAGNINILAGEESDHKVTDTLFKQSGFTLAVGGGAVGALVSSIETERNLFDTANQAHDGRVNTMVAANAAIAGYQGYQAATNLASQLGSSGGGASGLSVSLTYGMSEATSHSVTNATQAVGSSVSGQNITLVARGGNGTAGDLVVTGSSINAAQDASLVAAHDLSIMSAQNTYANTTTNKSESGSVGVAASMGQGGVALGVTVSAAYGHGDANTSSVQQVNSQVSAGNQLTFASGADTTLAGAVLLANQVTGQVGGNLTIQSLQDTLQSHSSQTNVSASATFGYGASVSASYDHASSHANYANVVQQSGIEAGDGGYDVHVGGNTNLVGGLLTSTQAAVDANRNTLTTGTLTTSNLQNVSDGSASTMGLGASFNTGATFGQALKDDPNNKNYADPGNNNYLAANGGKYGLGRAVVQNLMNNGSASSSSSGETLSAISAGNIQVRDTQPRTAQTLATLEANAQADTNMQATAPDVVALQKSAADEQTGNQLLFNAGSWATDQGALKDALAAFQRIVGCKIASGTKVCETQQLSGSYAIAPDSAFNLFLNGIKNNPQAAGDNAGDLAVLFTTPLSAGNTVVVNDYSPEVSGIGSLLAGFWNSINSNHAHGALGTTAGAALAAKVAAQINQANNDYGLGVTFNLMAHSDGTAQLMLSMEQYPTDYQNANGNTPTLVMLAEPSANAKEFQAIVNAYDENVGVVYSANRNDAVATLVGGNPPTGGDPNSLFIAGPVIFGSGGWSLASTAASGISNHRSGPAKLNSTISG